jgi:hypothetical protein
MDYHPINHKGSRKRSDCLDIGPLHRKPGVGSPGTTLSNMMAIADSTPDADTPPSWRPRHRAWLRRAKMPPLNIATAQYRRVESLYQFYSPQQYSTDYIYF